MTEHRSFNTRRFTFKNYLEMTDSESDAVHTLRNLPEVRKWMVNTDPIDEKSHREFIGSLQHRHDKDYYIVYDTEENGFVGTVNLAYTGHGTAERGIVICPDLHGKGYGSAVLTELYAYLAEKTDITTITTRVMTTNVPSNRLEARLGARLTECDGMYNFYSLELK